MDFDISKRILAYIMIIIGIVVNIVSSWWITYQLTWINNNPPTGASGGAAGAFILIMVLPLILSWVVLIYAGRILKESEIEEVN